MGTNDRRAARARTAPTTAEGARASVPAGWTDRASAWVVGRFAAADRERGDVPGWVLVTLMTAGLVTLLWALAAPALGNVFSTAISGVTKP